MTSEPVGSRNPFASRYVRPGALAFRFAGGTTAAQLVDRLTEQHWRGQIVGPHGSGKSTLLAALVDELRRRRVALLVFTLRAGERRLPRQPGSPASPKLVLVDGYEQLAVLQRWKLRLWCWRHGCGLLVTTHNDRGLPELYRTEPTPALLRELVDQLADEPSAPGGGFQIDNDDLAQLFSAHQGNLREALFALYDWYEARVRRPGSTVADSMLLPGNDASRDLG